MSYDQYGLGFAELCQVAMCMPDIYTTLEPVIEEDPFKALVIARKAVKLYNMGLIAA